MIRKFFVATVVVSATALSGCGEDGVISRFMLKPDRIIVERRPDPVYERLFPYYVELCATSQFRSKLKGEGGVAGHAVMYIKGACKDEQAPYPQLRRCRVAATELDDPEHGAGVSVIPRRRGVVGGHGDRLGGVQRQGWPRRFAASCLSLPFLGVRRGEERRAENSDAGTARGGRPGTFPSKRADWSPVPPGRPTCTCSRCPSRPWTSSSVEMPEACAVTSMRAVLLMTSGAGKAVMFRNNAAR